MYYSAQESIISKEKKLFSVFDLLLKTATIH